MSQPLVSNTNNATLKAILKYWNHPRIIAIQKQIEKEVLKLDVSKASQSSDIPINVLKESNNISL